MFGIHHFGLFLAAGVLLNLTPGPDTAYILGRTVAQGREAGIASALGICAGSIVHTCAAATWPVRNTCQFSNRIRFYQTAWRRVPDFSWSGNDHWPLKAIRSIAAFSAMHERCGVSTRCSTNILNPKVALFFLAFLPQFIDPASPTKVLAFLILGLSFVTTGTVWCLVLAWFASVFSKRLRTNATIGRWIRGTAGALFIFLGIRLATARR